MHVCKSERPKTKDLSLITERGFTLIELSIVIVIIGLIVAGILGGQALVQQAKLQRQIQELGKYKIRFNTFFLEYNQYPGDMRNAQDFFTSAGVLNGNGNKSLDLSSDSLGGEHAGGETLSFFNHLSEAGLLDGDYDNTFNIESGYPRLKLNSQYGMITGDRIANNPAGGQYYQISNSDVNESLNFVLYLNVSRPTMRGSGFNDSRGVATPKLFQAIDRKMDDGTARTGKFRAHSPHGFAGGNGGCLTGVNGDYNLINELDSCLGEYLLQ